MIQKDPNKKNKYLQLIKRIILFSVCSYENKCMSVSCTTKLLDYLHNCYETWLDLQMCASIIPKFISYESIPFLVPPTYKPSCENMWYLDEFWLKWDKHFGSPLGHCTTEIAYNGKLCEGIQLPLFPPSAPEYPLPLDFPWSSAHIRRIHWTSFITIRWII